ncbi:DUF4244 domain-containing protein [Microbacterium sp. ABRD28]|nr:DUF4244 domain-containing protein [Microbacterium sp. ABRD28]
MLYFFVSPSAALVSASVITVLIPFRPSPGCVYVSGALGHRHFSLNSATLAAVAFAGLLVLIMRSDEVRGILTELVRLALTVA